MPDRGTPAYERTLAEMGTRLHCRRACPLLNDLVSLGAPLAMATIRQRLLRVGARLEDQAAASPNSTPPAAATSGALSIDTAHVRAVRINQMRAFAIIVALTSNDNGRHMVFASGPDEACRQARQPRGVAPDLGATKTAPGTLRTALVLPMSLRRISAGDCGTGKCSGPSAHRRHSRPARPI